MSVSNSQSLVTLFTEAGISFITSHCLSFNKTSESYDDVAIVF